MTLVDERYTAERTPAAAPGTLAEPGSEISALTTTLGISPETARLIGEDTCAELARRLDNLSCLRGLCRIEPQVFNPNGLRFNEVREEPYVSTGERLADAVEKYDAHEQAMMARANTGKISHKGIRGRGAVRDTIDRLVPRLKDSDVPTDLSEQAMADAETVRAVLHAGMDCLGSLPRPTDDPTPEEFLDQLEALGDQLARLELVDDSTIHRVAGLLRVERAASAVELVHLMEPEPRPYMLPDLMVAAWTNQVRTWLEAREVARTIGQLTKDGFPPDDVAVIPMEPIEVPGNAVYRGHEAIHTDQAQIDELARLNGELHRLAQEVLLSFRGTCSRAAQRELGGLTAAAGAGLAAAEAELEAGIAADVDIAAPPYDLLPRGQGGTTVDPRHVRFVQQARQGVLRHYQAVKQELDSLVGRAANPWSEQVRRAVIDSPDQLPVAAKPKEVAQLSTQETSALIKGMANRLHETAAGPVVRVLSGKPSKKTKQAAAAGNPEAREELRVRAELRDSCGFDQQSIGVVVAIVQQEWPALIESQAALAARYHDISVLAAGIGNPNLLGNHPLQTLAHHNFGINLAAIRTCLIKAGDKINGALSTPQQQAVRRVLDDYSPPVPARS